MSLQTVHSYRAQAIEDKAGRRSMETLLNCYCREIAQPDGELTINPDHGDIPLALTSQSGMASGDVLQISLPDVKSRLAVVVTDYSPTSNFHYLSSVYAKQYAGGWTRLQWQDLARLLLNELSLKYRTPFNLDLLQQIHDSVQVTSTILSGMEIAPSSAITGTDFIRSEQSLVYGHPFHPAPKSRQGFSKQDLAAYSPELGRAFQLHYFAVRRDCLMQKAIEDDLKCDKLVAAQAKLPPIDYRQYALIPCHPWQGRFLLQQPAVQRALADGRLQDLGQLGEPYYPTSSVRTVYRDNTPYFYKFSLHVRLTNCVRKNSHYELQSALYVSRLMRREIAELKANFPGFTVLAEPAYMTVDLHEPDHEANTLIQEGFGMILRETLDGHVAHGVTPILAGSLFGNHDIGRQQLLGLLIDASDRSGQSRYDAALVWFKTYVGLLVDPMLYCLFQRGIVFEPHLQNVLIGIKNAMPVQIVLRDFEGVKLVPDRRLDALQVLPARVRQSLSYSAEQGWNRIAYCLLVNHLCEAIDHFNVLLPGIDKPLWRIIHAQLKRYLERFGDEQAEWTLADVLSGKPLPCKANLINRVHRRADREAGYIRLPNPMQADGAI